MSKNKKFFSFTMVFLLSFAFIAGQSRAELASNTQTGYNSENSSLASSGQARDIRNINLQDVFNGKTGKSVTGENRNSGNTGGGTLTTGRASLAGDFTNDFNFNEIRNLKDLNPVVRATNECTGACSENEAGATSENNTCLTNKNYTDLCNEFDGKAVTGRNSMDDNSCGGATIDTGNAMVRAVEMNSANENLINMDTGCGDTCVSAENQNTGFGSDNSALALALNKLAVNNDNKADIDNDVTAKANTGDNSADCNSGAAKIKTGDAKTDTTVKNEGINTNVADLSLDAGDTRVSAENECTGAESCNEAEAALVNCVDVSNKNAADIDNNVHSTANTGGNSANFNNSCPTGEENCECGASGCTENGNCECGQGDCVCGESNGAVCPTGGITTGNANSDVKVKNQDINTNVTKLNIGGGDTCVSAENQNTGACSENQTSAALINQVDVSSANCADIDNNVASTANTGGNSSSFNNNCGTCTSPDCDNSCGGECAGGACGTSGGITTGNANSDVSISNQVNTNVTDITMNQNANVSAENECTGANSENCASATNQNTITVTNVNQANISNNVTSVSNTGNNCSNFNTGAGSITTGSSDVCFNVDNSGNNNLTK